MLVSFPIHEDYNHLLIFKQSTIISTCETKSFIQGACYGYPPTKLFHRFS